MGISHLLPTLGIRGSLPDRDQATQLHVRRWARAGQVRARRRHGPAALRLRGGVLVAGPNRAGFEPRRLPGLHVPGAETGSTTTRRTQLKLNQ